MDPTSDTDPKPNSPACRRQPRWVLSTLDGFDGDLVAVLTPDDQAATLGLLWALDDNPLLYEHVFLAFLFMAAPEDHPADEVA